MPCTWLIVLFRRSVSLAPIASRCLVAALCTADVFNYATALLTVTGRWMGMPLTPLSQAICGPTRNSFLTGRRPQRTQVWNFINSFRGVGGGPGDDWLSFPQYFKKHGYTTLATGKVSQDPSDSVSRIANSFRRLI